MGLRGGAASVEQEGGGLNQSEVIKGIFMCVSIKRCMVDVGCLK